MAEPCGAFTILSDGAKLSGAFTADILAAVSGQAPVRSTEDAGRLILLQDDLVLLYVDLKCIAVTDVHGFADLNGQYNSAELVNFSDHSGLFHRAYPPVFGYLL